MLSLERQEAYRSRYAAANPGWRPASHVYRDLVVAHLTATTRVLDLGCGSGRNAVYLAGRGHRVTAIDLLPDALERAAALAARHGVELDLHQLDLRRQHPRGEHGFDLILMVRFLARDLWPWILSVLRPGGLLLAECPNPASLRVGAEEFWKDPSAEIVHFIGKDIVYHHYLFWSAMPGESMGNSIRHLPYPSGDFCY